VINADARPEQPNDPNGAATSHSRRYNAPQKYVGKLFGEQKYGEVLMADAETHGRDLVVQLRGGGLQYIHETHRSFDALHFVLLFPRGEDGWTIGLRKANSRQQVSPCNFYAHKLQWRQQCIAYVAAVVSRVLLQRIREGRDAAAVLAAEEPENAAGGIVTKLGGPCGEWRCG